MPSLIPPKSYPIEVRNLTWVNKISDYNWITQPYCYQIILKSHCNTNRSESYRQGASEIHIKPASVGYEKINIPTQTQHYSQNHILFKQQYISQVQYISIYTLPFQIYLEVIFQNITFTTSLPHAYTHKHRFCVVTQ